MQVALTGLESGLGRNLKTNPDWQPDDPFSWAIHGLNKLVGREKDWQTMDVESIRKFRDEARGKDFVTLRDSVSDICLSDNDDDQSDEPDGESSQAVTNDVSDVEDDTANVEEADDDDCDADQPSGMDVITTFSMDDASCILDE